jgi:hypothetical protein
MIERTKARLDEARSFLCELQREKFNQVQNAKPTASSEFFSRLDAFITAARSVTWVLQNEEKQKYDAWKDSPGATLTTKEQEIFNLINEMRIGIEKRGRPGIVARRERVIIPENPDPIAGTQYFGLPEWGRPTTNIDVYYLEGTDREVVSICEQYLEILTRLIDDFAQKYLQP